MAANSKIGYGPLDEWGIEDYLATIARSEDLGKRMLNAGRLRAFLRPRGITDRAFEIYNALDFINGHREELSSNPEDGMRYGNLEIARYAITDIAIPIRYYSFQEGDSALKIRVYPVEVADKEIVEAAKKEPAFFKHPVYLAVDSKSGEPGDYLVGKRWQIDLLVPNIIRVCNPKEFASPEASGFRKLEELSKSFPEGAKVYRLDRDSLAAGAKQSFFNRLSDMGPSLEDLLMLELVSREYNEVDGEVRLRVHDSKALGKIEGYS
jgi:hypothetical protein